MGVLDLHVKLGVATHIQPLSSRCGASEAEPDMVFALQPRRY